MTLEASFAAACDRLLGADFSEKLGVAVSGGSDSTALLELACAQFGADRISAVSVDHGLRAEAGAELAQVGALCAARGCQHQILHWRDWDQHGNLQAEARAARYRLMSEWASGAGIGTILLGHTADDQAETVVMRLARGSGVDGLAAMQPIVERDGTRWARPLLDMTREDLRTYLKARGSPWSEDPTNDDEGFDRIRLRQMMPQLAAIGLDRDRLIQTAEHMGRARSALRAATQALARAAVSQDRGDLVLTRAAFDETPDELKSRLLADALCFVSGHSYRPRYAALRSLMTRGAGTLHGAQVSSTPQTIRITREVAALRDVESTPDALFDGRWKLTGPIEDAVCVRALGEAGLTQLEDWRKSGLPRPSLLASPGIWRAETLIAAPLALFNPAWSAEMSGNRADFLRYLPDT